MSDNQERSRTLIEPYLGKTVEAKLDGSLFDHQPTTFRFSFVDPAALWETLKEDYEDYLEEWDDSQLVPVAGVSAVSAPDYQFAWIFLDWRRGQDEPAIVVTTTDSWSDKKRTLPSLGKLGLQIV